MTVNHSLIKFALMFSVLCLSSAHATNGSNFIASGAISRGLGGTGTAAFVGAENVAKNPSLMEPQERGLFEFAGTMITAEASSTNEDANLLGKTSKEQDSSLNKVYIPYIGYVYKFNEKMNWGLMFSGSGMGVDHRDENTNHGLFAISSHLTLLKFTPAVSYRFSDKFRMGVGLPVTAGQLSVSYDNGNETGRGASMDQALSYDIGMSYHWENFILGFNYLSKARLKYKHQLRKAAQDFGVGGIITNDELDQPSEITVGVGYVWKKLSASVDYKIINWSKAAGYREFKWEDQKLVNLGVSYALDQLTARLGASLGKSPIGEDALNNPAGTPPNNAQVLNMLNNLALPASLEDHYTAGLSYEFSQEVGMDFAIVYAPAKNTSAKFNAGGGDMTYKMRTSQVAYTLGITLVL